MNPIPVGFTPFNITIALAGFLIIAGCLLTNASTIMKALKKIPRETPTL
ncbi:MAG: hypothetical protein KTR28_03140 [Micavibrio sp.]|nr:hypothetical protein [Micavibrio sp.]